MAVRDILLLGNPILRRKCSAVKSPADSSVKRAMRDLSDTLQNFRAKRGFGRGIAAPQIGVGLRIIFIRMDAPVAMINPKILKRSKTMMTLWDDCFSFPDLLARVKRHSRITVSYTDRSGKRCQLEAEGGLSELLQHEIDHLDGILAIDRAIDSRHIILRSEYEKMLKTGKDIHPL